MSAISGLLTLQAQRDLSGQDEWVSEYQDTILVRNARGLNAGATLFGLMSRLKNEPAETVEYKWFERDPVLREVKILNAGTAYTSSSTSIVVTDGASSAAAVGNLCQAGTILKTSSGELLRVTAVSDDSGGGFSTLTVSRAFGGTTASATGLANTNVLIIVTLGRDEGAAPAGTVFQTPTTLTNYIQTFNASVNLTNAFKGSKLRTDIEGPLRERRVQALERISRDIEMAYFLGAKVQSVSGGVAYYTGGIQKAVDAISSSPTQALAGGGSGGVALATVNDWLASFLTLGSDMKLAFCGPKAYAAFSNYANSGTNGYRITGQESVFGMNITSVNTPFGELNLAMHPLFKEVASLNDFACVVDLALIVQKVMEPLFLEPNIQTPGSDTYQEQFRAKYGLKLKFPQAFGYATSFQKIT